MRYKYRVTCDECGEEQVKEEAGESFCSGCLEVTDKELQKKLCVFRVIIAVDGYIDEKQVSGVTSREVTAVNRDKAKRKALQEFRDNPDYNTDISVNKDRFPEGEYLDNWGYDVSSARVIEIEPVDEATRRVRWRNYR